MFHPEHPELSSLITEREVNARIVSLPPKFDQIPGGSHLDGATNEALPVEGHFRAVSTPSVEIIHDHVDAFCPSRTVNSVHGAPAIARLDV